MLEIGIILWIALGLLGSYLNHKECTLEGGEIGVFDWFMLIYCAALGPISVAALMAHQKWGR